MISDSTFTGGPTGALFWSSRDDHLSEPALKEFWQMGFSPMKFKPESGADRIKSADDAYSFMVHMRLSYQNKPHWQVRGRRSTKPACQRRAKFERGDPFGRRQRRRAGLKSLTSDL